MDKTAIYKAKKSLILQNLGQALHEITPLLSDYSYSALHERISNIKSDYELMLSYMRQGYADPSRDQVYRSLLRRLDGVVNEANFKRKCANNARLSSYLSKVSQFSVTPHVINKTLEDYVSDLALNGLHGFSHNEDEQQIQLRHHTFISHLFEQICFSGQWRRGDGVFYEELILSPTIDTKDACIMVSAITLSSITYFDIYKYLLLAHVYQKSTKESVKQRALVGWALTTTRTHAIYDEVNEVMDAMVNDENTTLQLLELQTQMFFCLSAERDQAKISRYIMPNLMKNKGFDITKDGIVEKEDDPMQDILDPGASDRAMEELEESFHRMMEMQRNGSDIYFGGFSQMKRYPFFYTLCNWFCPYYPSHPGISETRRKFSNEQFLTILGKNGPFCDSDKYSFALALSTIIDKVPENMRSMLNDGAAFGPTASDELINTPSNIRLMYLQDLYRFFRLCDSRDFFYNPFGGEEGRNAIFMSYDIIKDHIHPDILERIGNFMMKRGEYLSLGVLLQSVSSERSTPQLLMLQGLYNMHKGLYSEAITCFQKSLESAPDNKRALSGLGRCAMYSGQYDLAETAYSHLVLQSPDNCNNELNLSIAMLNNGKASKACSSLFKLSYENPNNAKVTRVLAWCLLSCQKPEQALKQYRRLFDSGDSINEDLLNASYCHWVLGDLQQALSLMNKYRNLMDSENKDENLEAIIFKDKDVLVLNGLSLYDILMMIDMAKHF